MSDQARWWQSKSRLDLENEEEPQVHLRVIAVNDLYELQNMARFKTCIDLYRVPNTISMFYFLSLNFSRLMISYCCW